ncbi:MAG: peptidoglycan DD-metalloendopeptidase family protein [Gammaproteobacteria bacterium]|nr:peptidoglycan DD-metalloendopeptidase family protein [Gammaproteobacteria bacterium]
MDNSSLLKRDYKGHNPAPHRTTVRRTLAVAGILTLIGASIMLAPTALTTTAQRTVEQAAPLKNAQATEGLPVQNSNAQNPSGTARTETPATTATRAPNAVRDFLPYGQWKEATVLEGESLAVLFNRLDIDPQQLHQLISIDRSTKQALSNIQPGAQLRVNVAASGVLNKFIYVIDQTHTLYISRLPAGLQTYTDEITPDVHLARGSGTIDSSLFLAGQQANLPDSTTMQLANIFGWDIDFALDIRHGDHFSVIYEELYLGDKKLRNGNIIAAEFVNQGKRYQAYRYTDPDHRSDYYSADGKNLRKAFLRTPVEFSRISSRFTQARFHPVLNRIRAHKGVDYAAPTGTPIRATGDGRIVFHGVKGGYGKTLVIQHGSQFSTLYGHMNAYARNALPGQRVRQGQVIGYVGSTGLATGPHLHYEFRINGAHRNPLTVKFPDASPLPTELVADFNNHIRPLLAQLDAMGRTSLAMNDTRPLRF